MHCRVGVLGGDGENHSWTRLMLQQWVDLVWVEGGLHLLGWRTEELVEKMWKMQVTLGGAGGCGRWNGGWGWSVWGLVGGVGVTNGRNKGLSRNGCDGW